MENDKEIKSLQKKMEQARAKIAALGEMRPGSLSQQFNVCGNPNCACKDKDNPKKHGPYHQLSYTRGGKSRTEFVKNESLSEIEKQLANYSDFIKLKDEWIDCTIQIAKRRKELQKNLKSK